MEKSLNADIPADLHDRFRRTCDERGIAYKKGVADALEAWLGTPVDEETELALKVMAMLKSGERLSLKSLFNDIIESAKRGKY